MNKVNGELSHQEKQQDDHVSNVLLIENLVRPFTLAGLKKVLSKYGKINEEQFWIDKDKSKCCVVYENNEIASESKKYISGLKWPASNPNLLIADYSNLEKLNEFIKKEEELIEEEKERKEAAKAEALAAAKAEEEKEKKNSIEEESIKINKIENGENFEENTENSNQNRNGNTETIEREKTPSKNEPTNVIFITNLVRPFTIQQLKELLTKHGPIIEEKFWIDKIKSKCYAVYEKCDNAQKSRNYIHGLKWPSSNPKTLKVDFAKISEINDILKIENDKKNQEIKKTNDNIKSNEKNFIEKNNNSIELKPEKNLKEVSEQIVREKTPPKNSVTNIVFIKNLVRPFTLSQLKEVLSKDGPINEEKFWIDKIKSKCYAVYENNEIALASRNRLHGLKWPNGNQKLLIADFSTEEELNDCLNLNKIETQKKQIENQQMQVQQNQQSQRNNEKEKRIRSNRNEEIDTEHKKKIRSNEHLDDINNSESSLNKRRRIHSTSPKEKKFEDENWSQENRIREKEKQREHIKNYEQDSPAKLLDDLFRKTKATPCIYWMPLNEDEIKNRDQRKLNEKRYKEHFDRNKRFPVSLHSYNNSRRRSPRRDRHYPNRALAPVQPRSHNQFTDKRRNYSYERERSLDRFERTRKRSPIKKSRSSSNISSLSRSRSLSKSPRVIYRRSRSMSRDKRRPSSRSSMRRGRKGK